MCRALIKNIDRGKIPDHSTIELGVRPEFVKFADEGLPVKVNKISDAGRYQIVEVLFGDLIIKLLVSEENQYLLKTLNYRLTRNIRMFITMVG